MNNRSYFLLGVFLSVFIIYKVSTYESEVEQQAVSVEHVKEAIALAKNSMSKVDSYFEDFHSLPISNNEVGLPHPSEISSNSVKSVQVHGGMVIVKFKRHLQQGVEFRIKPEFTRARPVALEWRCNHGDLNKQFFIDALPECMFTDSDLKADLIKGIRTADIEIMQAAIDDGVDVNQTTFYSTPLFFAIEKGKIELVELLINNGAEIDLASENSPHKTPLMHALTNGSSEIVKLLVDRGADVNAKDNKGKTVLRYVRVNYLSAENEIKDYLIDAGAIADNF